MKNYKRGRKGICFLLVFYLLVMLIPSTVWAEEMPTEDAVDLEENAEVILEDSEEILDLPIAEEEILDEEESSETEGLALNSNSDMPPIVITGANNFTSDDGNWSIENRTGAFNNALGKPLLKNGGAEPSRINFQVYIPEEGYYYVSGRALTQKGTATDKWLNRTFWVAFVNNDITTILEGSDPITDRDDDDFDSFNRGDGTTPYLFGARNAEVSTLGYYEYVDAKRIYLDKGETTVSIFGYNFARMDYLAISRTRQTACNTKENYDLKYGQYETTEISLSAEVERNKVELQIDNLTGKGVDAYRIYKNTQSVERQLVAELSRKRNSFTDYVVQNHETIEYWVEAVDWNMNLLQSNVVEVSIDVNNLAEPIVITGNSFYMHNWHFETREGIQPYNSSKQYFSTLEIDRLKKGIMYLYVPKSGYYHVYGRTFNKNDYDYERKIMVSIAQGEKERFIEGSRFYYQNPNDYNCFLINDINKYAFGANRYEQEELGAYQYCDAEPIYLEEGPAALYVHGYNFARLDYLVVCEDVYRPCSQEEYNEALLPYEHTSPAGGMVIEDEPSFVWENIFKATVTGGTEGFLVYGIDSQNNELYLGSTNSKTVKISNEKLRECEQLKIIFIDEQMNFGEQYLDCSEIENSSYYLAVFTGGSGFEMVPDKETFHLTQWEDTLYPYDGVFNHTTQKYYTPGELPSAADLNGNKDVQSAIMKKEIYIPEDGTYYVYGRAVSGVGNEKNHGRNYTFTVTVNGSVVKGTRLMRDEYDNDFDSVAGSSNIPNYLFGARRNYVSQMAGYLYTDAQPLELRKGFGNIEIKGFDYAGLDFIVLSNVPPEGKITRAFYDKFIAKYEDVEEPEFVQDIYVEELGNQKYKLHFQAMDNIGIAGYKILQVRTGGEDVVLADVNGKETEVEIRNVRGGPWAALQVAAYDYCGNNVLSNVVVVSSKNTQYSQDKIIITAANRFSNNPDDVKKNENEDTWWHEHEPDFTPAWERYTKGVFNQSRNYLRTRALKVSPARTEFKIYVPEAGGYYISARALSRKGGAEDIWLNRCFAIGVNSYVISGGNKYYYRDNDNFDTYFTWDGAHSSPDMEQINYGYMFGARNPSVTDLAFYNYEGSSGATLKAGENTITLYGMPLAGMDYIVFSKEPLNMPQNEYDYDNYYLKYEDITPPAFVEGPIIQQETDTYIDISYKLADYHSKIWKTEIYYLHKGEETLITTIMGDSSSYRCLKSKNITEGEIKIKAYDYYNNVVTAYCDNEDTARQIPKSIEITGSIDYLWDSDYYVFSVPTARNVLLSCASNVNQLEVYVYDADGNKMQLEESLRYRGTDKLYYTNATVNLEANKKYLLRITGWRNSDYKVILFDNYHKDTLKISSVMNQESVVSLGMQENAAYGLYTFRYNSNLFELIDLIGAVPEKIVEAGAVGNSSVEYVTPGTALIRMDAVGPVLVRLKALKAGEAVLEVESAFLPK